MAKISTRSTAPSSEVQVIYDRLLEVISNGTGGAISTTPLALIPPGSDVMSLLNDLELVFEAVNKAGRVMMIDMALLRHENLVLNVKYEEMMDVLSSFMDVSYDEPLDHAAADLMDAFVGTGAAEANAQGELQFDSRITMGRSDIKPVLREAILRWVDLKMQ